MRFLALMLLSGCLYVDPVNTPPTGRIIVPAGPYLVGASYSFDASASDPDDDSLRYEWSCAGLACSAETGTTSSFVVTVRDHSEWQVALRTVDSHGAANFSETSSFVVTDRAPVLDAVILTPVNVLGGYTVTESIAIAAGTLADPDGDPVSLIATVQAPPASDPNHARFEKDKPDVWTLVPDVPGHWQVTLGADDGFGGTAMKTIAFEVDADQPPCIAVTSPDASGRYVLPRDGGPRRFAVASVTDDLDPVPGTGHLAWSLGGMPVAGHDLADFTVDPADYLPGDVVELRVEVSDRIDRTLPCADDQPRCSIGGDACLQRTSWELEIR